MTDVGEGSLLAIQAEWQRMGAEYKAQIEEVTRANAKLLGKLQRAQGHIERMVKQKRIADQVMLEGVKVIEELKASVQRSNADVEAYKVCIKEYVERMVAKYPECKAYVEEKLGITL